ncbi:MAG: hypothetical protein E7Z65_02540 [Thermoplasmata archaeon]|nr:hypothetical protein [Thermoplasmata archaeon]
MDARGILGACVETVIPTRELEPKSGKLAWECLPKGWFRKIMAREIKFACIAHNTRLLIDSGLVRI